MPDFTGVSLTSDSKYLYAAEMTRSRDKAYLKNLTQVEIAPSFTEAVQQLVQKAGLRGRKAVLALSGHEAIVRCFEMPFIPRREVPAAVRFEAQKYMPFEAKELHFDYETFTDLKRRKLRAVFLAARKDLIERWVGAFKAAGMEITAVEPDLMALLRLLTARPAAKNGEVHAFVSARMDGSLDIVVIKDKKPLMARYGVVAPSSTHEDSQFGRNFESFAKEIALSFNYFSKTFRNEEIHRIVWSADPGYESEKWIQGLHARFDIPVDEWNLSRFLGKAEPVSPATAVLIGAALRPPKKAAGLLAGFLGRRIPDLLPVVVEETRALTALAWEEEKKLLIRHAIHAGLFAMAGIFAAHLLFLPGISAARKNRGILADKSLAELQEVQSRAQAQVSYLSALFDRRYVWSEKLSDVARHVPAEIQLIQLEITDTEDRKGESSAGLKIEGSVVLSDPGKELSAANRFVGALMSDPGFMKGFDSAILTRVRKTQDPENRRPPMTVFAVECASKKRVTP